MDARLQSMHTTPVDSEVARWTRAARRGSQPAFAALYARFAPLVHAILLGRMRPAVADELTQECFALAFARLGQLRDGERFGAWVAAIARRIDAPSREFASDVPDDIVDPQATPEQRAEAARVLAAIATLPEAYRETLVLRLVEGLGGPEIAALTDLTAASVRVNLHRGMRLLRAALGIAAGPQSKETSP